MKSKKMCSSPHAEKSLSVQRERNSAADNVFFVLSLKIKKIFTFFGRDSIICSTSIPSAIVNPKNWL